MTFAGPRTCPLCFRGKLSRGPSVRRYQCDQCSVVISWPSLEKAVRPPKDTRALIKICNTFRMHLAYRDLKNLASEVAELRRIEERRS